MLQTPSWGAHLWIPGFETAGLQSVPPVVCQLLATADKVQGTALETSFAMGNLCISTEMRSCRRPLVTAVLVSSDCESPLILLTFRPGPVDSGPGLEGSTQLHPEAADSNIQKFTEQNVFIKNLPQAGEHDSLHISLAV